jgi:hypothetical protein
MCRSTRYVCHPCTNPCGAGDAPRHSAALRKAHALITGRHRRRPRYMASRATSRPPRASRPCALVMPSAVSGWPASGWSIRSSGISGGTEAERIRHDAPFRTSCVHKASDRPRELGADPPVAPRGSHARAAAQGRGRRHAWAVGRSSRNDTSSGAPQARGASGGQLPNHLGRESSAQHRCERRLANGRPAFGLGGPGRYGRRKSAVLFVVCPL